ncbi:TraM recognition domain-containing protein [Thermodesulfobacteriota bacterium]
MNLSKGEIGEDSSSLLGAMMITMIQLAALDRTDIPEERRVPFYLYVDEIHSFATLSFADILSEARKYGLSLTLAHQYIGQLDEKIRQAIFGNVGTMICFRVGQEDARVLAREFYPDFDETDLVSLPNHHIYLRLMIDGLSSKGFSATTLPPTESSASHKSNVVKVSRERYGQRRSEVEKEVLLKELRIGTGYHMRGTRNQRLPL